MSLKESELKPSAERDSEVRQIDKMTTLRLGENSDKCATIIPGNAELGITGSVILLTDAADTFAVTVGGESRGFKLTGTIPMEEGKPIEVSGQFGTLTIREVQD